MNTTERISDMATVVCYVSGHGFGHAVRVMEVVNALWHRRPDVHVAIRTPAPTWFFDINLDGPFTLTPCQLDTGAVQRDSLHVDPEASLQAYAALARGKARLVAAEVAALAPARPALVLADIPALAFDVAARLGIPGVAMTNFSWDWIYADYVEDFPSYAGLVDDLRSSYARATLLLRLPLHGDLSAFPRVRDIPFVARRARLGPAEARRRLGLPQNQRLVLLSFGGLGVALQAAPSAPAGVLFVTNQPLFDGAVTPWCHSIPTEKMAAAGVRYEDLVAASDAVMTKPGYGIVAECIANATPMVYTPRGRFAEYACLLPGIAAHLPYVEMTNDDLYAGRWRDTLDQVLARDRHPSTADVSGAAAAARALLEFLDNG